MWKTVETVDPPRRNVGIDQLIKMVLRDHYLRYVDGWLPKDMIIARVQVYSMRLNGCKKNERSILRRIQHLAMTEQIKSKAINPRYAAEREYQANTNEG